MQKQGKFPSMKKISETPVSSTTNPDQPLSHVHPAADPNDPLAKIKVPCYGDQRM